LLPFLKIAVTYPVFQSEGNWFKTGLLAQTKPNWP